VIALDLQKAVGPVLSGFSLALAAFSAAAGFAGLGGFSALAFPPCRWSGFSLCNIPVFSGCSGAAVLSGAVVLAGAVVVAGGVAGAGAAGFWSGVDCAIPICAIKKATNRNV